MGSLSTLFLSCIHHRKQTLKLETPPPVPAKDDVFCEIDLGAPGETIVEKPRKLVKKASIRIVEERDSDVTLVSEKGDRNEGGNERDNEGKEDDVKDDGVKSEDTKSEDKAEKNITKHASLPEIKSRVIEDIPEEEEDVNVNTNTPTSKSTPTSPTKPPKEPETTPSTQEPNTSSPKSPKKQPSPHRLSRRKSLIEIIHYLQSPSTNTTFKLPIPPRSPLRKRSSASSLSSLSAKNPPDQPTDPKKQRRMGAVVFPSITRLSTRRSMDALTTRTSTGNTSTTGKDSKSLFY